LLPSPRKQKSNRLAKKEGGFLGVARGNWGRLGAPQQHRQPLADPPSPDSTDPKISAYFNMTSTSSRLRTVWTLDIKNSWTPCRNSTEALAPLCKTPPLPSKSFFWMRVAHSQVTTIKRWSHSRTRVLVLKEVM
jgi:hypothetical protein